MLDRLRYLLDVIGQLNFTQKVVLGTLAIAAVIALNMMYNTAMIDYDVMFSGLDETDSAAIVHNLRKQGVSYKLADGGTTILVPRSKKEDLRLNAFQEDLIKSDNTLGFGVLDSLPFGLTDWQEQKYDQKIISDEVVKTLENIDGIRNARVLLAQGNRSVFSSDNVDATASVLLITEPGFRLPTGKVKTIKHLVARAVPGLNPDNVTVADSSGNTLSDDYTSGGSNADSSSMQRTVEKQKTKDILEMLTAVVGPNNAVVKVSAKMNFDQTRSHIKRFIPTGGTAENPTGIPVSVQQNSERLNGDKAGAGGDSGGAPGMDSNVPQYRESDVTSTSSSTTSADKSYNNTQQITNYEISSEERTVVHAPGTLEKLTVAVVINKVLTPTEAQEISNLVTNAAGLDATRGDTVQVSGLQFAPENRSSQEATLSLMEQSNMFEMIVKIVEMVIIFILAVIALFTLFRLLNKPLEGQVVYDHDDDHDSPVYTQQAQELISAATIPVLEAKMDPELEHMREAITTVVSKDPSEAARVLSTFISD